MNPATLLVMFFYTAANIAGVLLLFFWLRRRLAGAPAPAARADDPDDGAAPAPPPPPTMTARLIPPDYPYRSVPPLGPEERVWQAALEALNGEEYAVYPRVAADACMEPTKDGAGYRERLRGWRFDFVVCDRASGALVTTLLVRPGGRARPEEEDWLKACRAAALPVAVVDAAAEPTPPALREALGWPEPL